MADGTNISLDPKERQTRIDNMKTAGDGVKDAPAAEVEQGDLILDGLNKLLNLQNELYTVVKNYGNLILKDAGILQTISDNFNTLDNSVNG